MFVIWNIGTRQNHVLGVASIRIGYSELVLTRLGVCRNKGKARGIRGEPGPVRPFSDEFRLAPRVFHPKDRIKSINPRRILRESIVDMGIVNMLSIWGPFGLSILILAGGRHEQ